MSDNHESSNKDCHLILQQSERIRELEEAIQNFCENYKIARSPGFHSGYEAHSYEKFKQLLEKG